MKTEIQVRTLLEHAWADFGHDGVYKAEFVVPAKWKCELAGLAAILDCDPRNPEVAHRLGKLAMTPGDWPKAIDIFSKLVESGYQPILRDLDSDVRRTQGARSNCSAYDPGIARAGRN